MSCDARHPTKPDPSGIGIQRAINAAFDQQGMSLDSVVAIVAHGTGTRTNDEAEAQTLRRVFAARSPVVTSTKGALGHTMGAAGLFNLLTGYEICRSGLVPPMAVIDDRPLLEGSRFAVGNPVSVQPGGVVLCLCSGFGGNNVAIVLEGTCS